ncbi:MAG: hypothetical protein ACKOHM_00905 [Spartobacteria bacterium]
MLALVFAVSSIEAAPSETQDIAFAVPGQGLITLGVFNKAGKLVRILHAMDDEEAFRIGLNGYITQWDGRDDAGQKVPAGRYFLRGYLIGDVAVEGEAFHFNDWVSSAESPVPRRIEDFAMLPGGDLVIAGRTAAEQGFCARYSNEKGFLWSREIQSPGASTLLAVTNRAVVTHSNQGWLAFSLDDGSDIPLSGFPADSRPTALAADNERVSFSEGDIIKTLTLDGVASQYPAPARFENLATIENAVAGSAGGSVWISISGEPFSKIPVPASVGSLSFGEGKTLWFSGASMDPDASPVVAQTNFEGGILRALVPKPGDPRPVLVRASRTSDVFCVLEESPGLQRLRVLSRNPEGGWSIEWERSIQDAPAFGFIDGQASANAVSAPQPASLRFRLDVNPLTGKHDEATLQAAFGPEGVQLMTADGLPLVTVSHSPDIQRVAIQRGPAPDSLRLLQGNGAVVEEYLIQGLRHITPLTAGEVVISK